MRLLNSVSSLMNLKALLKVKNQEILNTGGQIFFDTQTESNKKVTNIINSPGNAEYLVQQQESLDNIDKELFITIKPELDKKDAQSPIADKRLAARQAMASNQKSQSQRPVIPKKEIIPPPPEPEPEKEKSPKKVSISKIIDNLDKGGAYLIKEDRPDICFEISTKLAKKQKASIIILSRTNPNRLKRTYDLEDVSLLWLTDRESEKESTVPPSLESIMYIIEEFLDRQDVSVILLDGMEYLVSNNQFNPVLRFLRRLIDKISESDAYFVVSVSPETLEEKELKLLERELEPVDF